MCELPCKNDTKSIKGALITARIIGNVIYLFLGAESWTGWVAVNQITDGKGDGYDYSDGLISATNGFNYYYIAKDIIWISSLFKVYKKSVQKY